MSDTETESEPETATGMAAQSAQEFANNLSSEMQQDAELQNEARPVSSAMKLLGSLDFRLVRKDKSLHKDIQVASGAILKFLDNLLSLRFNGDQGLQEALTQLPELLHYSSFCLLFQYRRLFHVIAAQGLIPGVAIPTVICWVDVILAKVGDVAAFVAGGLRVDDCQRNSTQVLKLQREDNQLRAAAQLPDKWDSVPSIISSNRASPAARRLALQLTLVRFVVHPQLEKRIELADPWAAEGVKPMELFNAAHSFLQDTITRLSTDMTFSESSRHDFLYEERMACAMGLSLFAVADLVRKEQEDSESLAPFRPHTVNQLLRLLQCVVHPEAATSPLHGLTPLELLDVPQTILVRWGKFVPWSWTIWTDLRRAETDTIMYLTITWLHHICPQSITLGDERTRDWETHLGPTLMNNIVPATTVASQLLCRCVAVLSLPEGPKRLAASVMDVILKIVWTISHFAESNACKGLVSHSSNVCEYLLAFFPLTCHVEDCVGVRELVIKTLTDMKKECILEGLRAAQANASYRFSCSFDEAVSEATRQLLRGSPDPAVLLLSRQLLDFVSLLCFSGTHFVGRGNVQDFLLAVTNALSLAPDTSEGPPSLLDSFLNTLAASSSLDPALDLAKASAAWDIEVIWQMASSGSRSDLLTASAFAHLIIVARELCGPLALAEAWSYLRDVLLLISSNHFLGDPEPLALIVAPVVCKALIRLLKHADPNAMSFIICSPWTLSLRAMLQNLLHGETPSPAEYSVLLRNRLSVMGEILLHQIVQKTATSNQKQPVMPKTETYNLTYPRTIPD
ncbi:hypothetical protein BV22DRAFT_1124521 [Leucogyrophana mollusca]|uniref:Uncharacterized protein n=1 Tax=Leucogyrophana mollusca TaxID=85980 RepID=A0ACB8C0K9_9AGAM|nr:hypothetical protein BV22DRAFT_1124521 [Leucogyrophana mollusca]